jgi:hypothetical protein
MSSLSVSQQKLLATDARLITVSEIVDEDGTKVRVVRFFADPIVNDAPTLLLEVKATSSSADDLKIATPTFAF